MRYPTVQEILDAHAFLTEKDEDRPHVVNKGVIESAVYRAEYGPFYGGEPDLCDRAAFLLRGVAQDHGFTNGNKRTAFAAADAMLRLNGLRVVAPAEMIETFMLAVATDEIDLGGMAEWLRNYSANL